MNHDRHRNRRGGLDPLGWLLGTTIVVLAVVDLLIWATLWNVPNPVSKLLLPPAAADRVQNTVEEPFLGDAAAQPLPLHVSGSKTPKPVPRAPAN